ncbi:hypothetical protein [Amycolatopsis lexingtonensis]|uniref:hypothetical protein n=1 Tax=Amycolatopsis lexingtonensis TaxID=218822 RepID=UPI003F6FB3BF
MQEERRLARVALPAAGCLPAQCAELTIHLVAVLRQAYATVIADLESAVHDRIEKALGWES